ncbi:MAG: hypothetical protein HYY32_00310 [Chloroflexi bacterium]|nr:hypothetical protein [Chloroflexota bacterium]
MPGQIAKKLLAKPGQRMTVLNAPEGYLDELGELPPGAQIIAKPAGTVDFIQVFVKDKAELESVMPGAIKAVKLDGLFWICYPKGSSKFKTDLNRDILREAVENYGLVGVSLVSINDVWSALRVRPKDKVGK